MAFENGALVRDHSLHPNRPGTDVEGDNPVDKLKILNSHAGSRSPLGGNKTVDAGAQVLQHEILLCGGFAVVDLLGPLLERQLDPEGLVDGERNVEEVQAVDP